MSQSFPACYFLRDGPELVSWGGVRLEALRRGCAFVCILHILGPGLSAPEVCDAMRCPGVRVGPRQPPSGVILRAVRIRMACWITVPGLEGLRHEHSPLWRRVVSGPVVTAASSHLLPPKTPPPLFLPFSFCTKGSACLVNLSKC